LDSIIGQFGVGFYSTFIVADSVEVYTKSGLGGEGVRWVSDGSGDYEVSTVENLDFERGTKIILKLKPDSREFSRESEVEKILKKYSLFITYPIKLNGQLINNLQAIWYREKREVTEDEYERFFEHLANTKVPYKFKLHYSTDVPLTIKAIFYVPSTHSEKMGMMQESSNIHLYCRKVLIKEGATELLPHYLRFVKGVVDCEDLPLNISRETYQDSALIGKLRNVVTRRVLKMLEDEIKRDGERYDQWYDQFNHFLKEGLMMDSENKESLLKLMRYHATY
jgi:TNF receptor-associated protein 1